MKKKAEGTKEEDDDFDLKDLDDSSSKNKAKSDKETYNAAMAVIKAM